MRKFQFLKQKIFIVLWVFIGAGLAQAKEAQWTDHMRAMRESFKELLPMVYSPDSKRVNLKQVEVQTKKLSEIAHRLEKQKMIPNDSDPSVRLMAGLFSKEVDRAYLEIKRGNWNYGRTVLKAVTGYCIACHTRNSWGPNVVGTGGLEPDFIKSLNPMGKGTFYAATRQFDRALEEFEKIISDHHFQKSYSLDWERAVRQSLTIAVRVKQDPARALSIADRVVSNLNVPYYLREEAEKWKKSLKEWQSESSRDFQTEEGAFAEVKRLMALARSFQEFPADRSADMLYLRASSVIHFLLRKFPTGKYVGEAYYLLGYSYEALRDMEIWNLHELYYSACIHQSPHTELAKSCYKSYEASVYAGYSGSGGMFVPDEIKQELGELEKLARPVGAL